MWYRVELPYAIFGIRFNEDDIVDEAPPIAKWMIGKGMAHVATWIIQKGGTMEELPKVTFFV